MTNKQYEELILDVKARLCLLKEYLGIMVQESNDNMCHAERSVKGNLGYEQDTHGKGSARDLADYIEQSAMISSYTDASSRIDNIIDYIDDRLLQLNTNE